MENKQEGETAFMGQGLACGLCMWVCMQRHIHTRAVGVYVRMCLRVFTEESVKRNVALILLRYPPHQLAS